MRDFLVIFDCDGVLVDSEPIALSVLGEMLGTQNVNLNDAVIADRFLGRSLGTVTSIVRQEFGVELPDDFPAMIRRRLFERYDGELRAIPGVPAVLDGLDARAIPYCVASSSLPERIEKSLSVTGLLDRFTPHIFSASMVRAGKPAPDLFLFAARQLEFEPSRCLVIEDSPAGIEAARAAGMGVFAFGGGGHARNAGLREKIAALKPDAWFDALPELLQRIDRVRSSGLSLHG
jgi:HAD superfamily hydrolase (TIGR01509 family)